MSEIAKMFIFINQVVCGHCWKKCANNTTDSLESEIKQDWMKSFQVLILYLWSCLSKLKKKTEIKKEKTYMITFSHLYIYLFIWPDEQRSQRQAETQKFWWSDDLSLKKKSMLLSMSVYPTATLNTATLTLQKEKKKKKNIHLVCVIFSRWDKRILVSVFLQKTQGHFPPAQVVVNCAEYHVVYLWI